MFIDDIQPFPLLAIVRQAEVKTALIMGLINPHIGGVLLSGPYGVGKTTAVRGLLDVMPFVSRRYEDANGTVQMIEEPMRLVELPLNARLEDVVGGMNERVAIEQQRVLLEEGILAKAHKNVLYVDEINLLDHVIVDAILDAAAQGQTLVRRGVMTRLFPSQCVLVGSMNPEEGTLRPQIMDRFGLRVWVAPVTGEDDRLEIYRRMQAFHADRTTFRARYAAQTTALREDIATAHMVLPHVVVPIELERVAIRLVQALHIPSHRAEIALLESARARAAADFRSSVQLDDLLAMAPLALRQRHSQMLDTMTHMVAEEDDAIRQQLLRMAHDAENT